MAACCGAVVGDAIRAYESRSKSVHSTVYRFRGDDAVPLLAQAGVCSEGFFVGRQAFHKHLADPYVFLFRYVQESGLHCKISTADLFVYVGNYDSAFHAAAVGGKTASKKGSKELGYPGGSSLKRIFITAHSLEISGAERSLLGLLENIDYSQYQVDLFLLRHTGELLPHLPKEVNLLPQSEEYSCLGVPIVNALRMGQLGIALGRTRGKRLARKRLKQLQIAGDNNVSNEYSHKYTVKWLPQMSDKEYDLAISFMSPHYFVAQKVKAQKKIAWIHTDYKTLSVDTASELQMWKPYDYIVSISDDVTKSFLHTFPSLAEKIVLVENIIPVGIMQEQARAFDVDKEMPEDGTIKLLTIGRFSRAKRMDEIPKICQKIRELGINIKWYLIGFGGDESLIRQKIAEAHAEQCVIILGKKENPYPYFKACDVYLQPSRYEGKSIAVREAQIFHKPVIITNYSTANSQLEDGVDGVIVPMELDACAVAIATTLKDKRRLEQLSMSTYGRDYVGSAEVKKIYSLMGE